MDPLGTNMYLLKRYRPSDSFCTFISESVVVNYNFFMLEVITNYFKYQFYITLVIFYNWK